jgi:hypothetical protein
VLLGGGTDLWGGGGFGWATRHPPPFLLVHAAVSPAAVTSTPRAASKSAVRTRYTEPSRSTGTGNSPALASWWAFVRPMWNAFPAVTRSTAAGRPFSSSIVIPLFCVTTNHLTVSPFPDGASMPGCFAACQSGLVCVVMRQDEWSRHLVGVIADGVRWHRKRRKMSAQQLADECSRLGYPVPRSVLTNLENGRRETVSIAEWLVLSAALKVPPVLLLFPLWRGDAIEPLPGVKASPWHAVQWVIADRVRPDVNKGPAAAEKLYADAAIFLFHMHDREVKRAGMFSGAKRPDDTLSAREVAVETRFSTLEELVRRSESIIWQTRATMRHAGLTPPSLPPELAHIDDLDFEPNSRQLLGDLSGSFYDTQGGDE